VRMLLVVLSNVRNARQNAGTGRMGLTRKKRLPIKEMRMSRRLQVQFKELHLSVVYMTETSLLNLMTIS
jgi:hypothetical protein